MNRLMKNNRLMRMNRLIKLNEFDKNERVNENELNRLIRRKGLNRMDGLVKMRILTSACSISIQKRKALPTSLNAWNTSVLRSGYCIRSLNWAW